MSGDVSCLELAPLVNECEPSAIMKDLEPGCPWTCLLPELSYYSGVNFGALATINGALSRHRVLVAVISDLARAERGFRCKKTLTLVEKASRALKPRANR